MTEPRRGASCGLAGHVLAVSAAPVIIDETHGVSMCSAIFFLFFLFFFVFFLFLFFLPTIWLFSTL